MVHSRELPLTLLEARVLLVNHKQFSFPLHNLAINAALFNGSSNFHCWLYLSRSCFRRSACCFSRSAFNYLYRNMILPLLKSYGLISTPTLSPGNILI